MVYGTLGSVVGAVLGLIALITIGTLAGLTAIPLGIVGGGALGILLYRQLHKDETKFIESMRYVSMLVQQNEAMDSTVSQELLDKSERNIEKLIDGQGLLIDKIFESDVPVVTVESLGERAAEPRTPLNEGTSPRPMLNPPNPENNDSSDERGTDLSTSTAGKPVDESNKK